MEIVGKLQKEYIRFMSSLLRDGFLDSQFLELQKLQDESRPDFVVEMVSLFFEEAEKYLNILTMSLQQQIVDFKQLDIDIHQLKGCSSRCMQCLQLAKSEYFLVKSRLETFCRVEQQIKAGGGGIPIIS